MKKKIVFILLALFGFQLHAQDNLVPNFDFEQIEQRPCRSCDEKGDFEYFYFPWKVPIAAHAPQVHTFDHAKVTKGVSFIGEPIPKSGDMTVGFYPYEYFSVRLMKPLRPGQRYYAECWVALRPGEKASCNNIGIYLSTEYPKPAENVDSETAPIKVNPQINESDVIHTHGEEWHRISGIFTAGSAFQYITIGNFFDMSQTVVEPIKKDMVTTDSWGYMLVDDVKVVAVTDDLLASLEEVPLTGEVNTFRLEKVTFQSAKAELTPGAHPELDAVASQMIQDGTIRVLISGHTDNVGTEDANLNLSTERSRSVKTYLVSKGVDAGRIEAKDFGSTEPVASNDTEEGRAQNRRVEVTIIKE